jgi:translation initiation factor IF-2
MSKIRVHELAKELNIESKELITILKEEFNIEVKNHMSTIEDEDAELIKELLAGKSPSDLVASADNAENSKSIVDVYEDELAEQLNKGIKKKKKAKKEEQKESRIAAEAEAEGKVI